MAALLRSARLLKFSPSGLLQIAGTNRTGPPLSRLYSGALGSRRTGGCSRLMSPAASSRYHAACYRLWPYAVGCARSYAVATDKKDEAGVAVRSKQAQQFDWALTKLDNSVRRTGRITKTLLLHIFHDICRTGYPSGNQALLLLRSCGYLLPEVPQEERTVLAHRMWEKLKELGAQFDVSHYNALLKVYLQNDFKFSPTDFLAKMEEANIQPNRVSNMDTVKKVFSILITLLCTSTPILLLLLPISSSFLLLRSFCFFPIPPPSFLSFLFPCLPISLHQTIEEAESADCNLMDRDIMQIILTLAKAGHQQHIPQMVERLKQERGYVPDAMNLCLSLITQGQEDTAFTILKNFPTLQPDTVNTDSPNLGNFFLRHCVNMDMAVEKIGHYCKELQDSNLHTSPLVFSLQCALEAKKTGTAHLMKILKEQGLPIRQHYFWPLLRRKVEKLLFCVLEVMKGMQELGVSPDAETLTTYVVPAFSSIEAAQQAFQVKSRSQCLSDDVESMVKVRPECAHSVWRMMCQNKRTGFTCLKLV
uniref:Leucine rich pentatricopeptide repeat containing n=1 Tax=Seriola lalandi dorsalis TaxID=1841481 RepID=A0A3B4YP36_SERLL